MFEGLKRIGIALAWGAMGWRREGFTRHLPRGVGFGAVMAAVAVGLAALLFDAPVSGYPLHVPVVEYAPGPRAWIDGGAFGPEGGIVATLVMIAGTAALIGPRLKRPAEWMTA